MLAVVGSLDGMQGVNARIDLAMPTSRPYCQAWVEALMPVGSSEQRGVCVQGG
jgi:hypothetical protein